MALIQRGLMLVATAGALAIPAHLPAPVDAGGGIPAKRIAAPTTADYQPNQLEYYLGDSGIAYIRPGVKVTLVSFTDVAPGKNPVAEVLLTDQLDQPLDRNGKVTPGPITPGFVLSRWDAATRSYFAFTTRTRNGATNPFTDQNGTWADLEVGHSKYTFGTKLPADFDVTRTYTLGIQAKRTLLDIIGKDYFADNVFKDFRPDGGAAGAVWQNMDVNKSCNNCHDPLAQHGGARRSVRLCVLCHLAQIGTDPTSGQTFNGKVFFHRIHMGKHLPSVVAGGTYFAGLDFSTVGWPGNNNGAPFDCTTCHETSAPEKDVWYTRPSRLACGSCHDDVDFATGKNHGPAASPVPPQLNDDECARCHQPQGDLEFDASIKGAHTQLYKSNQLKGLKAAIVSSSNMLPGKKPTVVYKLTNGDGTAVDGTKLATFAPILAGPTTSYTKYFRENGVVASTNPNPGVFDMATGNTTYTFTNAIPTTASGTWTLSADIYRNVNLKRGDGKADIIQRECAMNPVNYYSIDGSPVAPRRKTVDIANCNKCHGALGLHGGQRLTTEECVICHNPTEGDQARRPASAGAKESVSFQRLIHRIHTGEELSQDFTVYGFGGSVNNFNEVRFPGDRRDCVKCHTSTGYLLPLPTGIDSVTTLRDYFTPQGPGTAACLGCHDLRDNEAHAYLNTAPFGEACASCHGVGLEFGVDKVHAR